MPSFKAGYWDGSIRLVDLNQNSTYCGLAPAIEKWCGANDVEFKQEGFSSFTTKISFPEDFAAYLAKKYTLPFIPHAHQAEALRVFLSQRRSIILSPTASGKSLIAYLAVRTMLDAGKKKILLVVPSIGLVQQMVSDFSEYSVKNGWNSSKNCHQIYDGAEKKTDKPVIVSTWQSIYKMDKKFFAQFDVVLADEVHEYSAEAASSILEKSEFAGWRLGMTGTLRESKSSEMKLRALIGEVTRVASTHDLQKEGKLADLKVKGVTLVYGPKSLLPPISNFTYERERRWINNCEERRDFIGKLVNTKCNGNTLILVEEVDSAAEPLYEAVKKANPTRPVYLITGKTKSEERERLRRLIDTLKDAVIIATYGVYQRGVNIPSIKYIIFGWPTKSLVRVLQSIGRGLRKKKDGGYCTLFDISDDVSGGKKTKNRTIDHYIKRLEIYFEEKFEVSTHEVSIQLKDAENDQSASIRALAQDP